MDKIIVSGRATGKQAKVVIYEFTDFALLKAGYGLLRAENNRLSLENNRLMGCDLKSEIISRVELGLIRNALEDIVSTLTNRYDPATDLRDLSEPYAEILKKLDQLSDQTEKTAFKILEAD